MLFRSVLIPALGAAWDELRTGRAAGPRATDAEKAQHLLALAKDLRGDDRRVVWCEAVVLADPDGVLFTWESAATEGRLTEAYDPANAIPGFWVYSLWWFPDAGNGVKAPYTIHIVGPSRPGCATITFERIQLNVAIDDTRFVRPPSTAQ